MPARRLDPIELGVMRTRLLARIHRRGYVTLTQEYLVGPLRLPFTRIADPDVVLDRVVKDEDRREKLTGQRPDDAELYLPYWAELWESALGLGVYLTTRNLRCKSVLDLGCGMGFAGMVAAAMGSEVLLADIEPDALLFARLNTLRWSRQIRLRRLNWQTNRLRETFDIVLGADVLYDRTQWEFLEPFFRAHAAPEGCVLLGEPGRQTGDLFPDWIVARGWTLGLIERNVPPRTRPIRIFRLTRAHK